MMKNDIDVTAAIIAGGLGTRLKKILPDTPKTLADIHGRPFLSYLLDQISKTDIQNVILCTGYLSGQIRQRIGTRYKSLFVKYSVESKPLGTGGALRLALSQVNTDYILAMNGDSIVNLDLNQYLMWFFKNKPSQAICIAKVPEMGRYGTVSVGKKDKILSFHEKDARATSNWINAGVYLLQKEQLLSIPENSFHSLEYDFFPAKIHEGIYGYRTNGDFIDIGTPESFNRAEKFFQNMNTAKNPVYNRNR